VKLAGMLSIATAAVAAAVLLTAAFAPPAIAQSPPDSVVYFPLGNGATYSCAGGPPFVVNNHHHSGDSPGNCAIRQIGPPPVGLVCDIPTTITFTHEMHPWTTDVWLCQMQYGGQMQYGIGAQAPTATGGASPARLAQTGGPPLVPLAGGAAAGLLLGGALLTTRRRRRRR
jgi:LPXTG-motif cell wall-anchored protein